MDLGSQIYRIALSVLPTPQRGNRRANADRKVSVVVPFGNTPIPWQGAPAARAPLHPHRQTGLSDSPSVCPDASAAGSGNRSGVHRSRCNVWPLHHQSGGAFQLPRHPHHEGSFRAPLNPIVQPYADWMRTIVFARWITSRGVPAPCNFKSNCRVQDR
jgi:hypothetical protein